MILRWHLPLKQHLLGLKLVVTCEEHFVIDGLGAIVSQVLSASYPVKMAFVGQEDTLPPPAAAERRSASRICGSEAKKLEMCPRVFSCPVTAALILNPPIGRVDS